MRVNPVRNRSGPTGRGDEEIARLGAGRPPAGRREDVRPHVEHRQEIIPTVRVRRGDDQRFLGEIEPRDGIERVEVRAHDALEIGRRIFRDAHEHIHRAFAEFLPGFDVRELLPRDVHRQERIEVDVGIDADGAGFLFGDRLRRADLRGNDYRNERQRKGEQHGDSNSRQHLWLHDGSPPNSLIYRPYR